MSPDDTGTANTPIIFVESIVRPVVSDGGDTGLPQPSVFDELNEIIPLEELKEQAVRHALEITEGSVQEASSRLKISRSTIYELMKKYGMQ